MSGPIVRFVGGPVDTRVTVLTGVTHPSPIAYERGAYLPVPHGQGYLALWRPDGSPTPARLERTFVIRTDTHQTWVTSNITHSVSVMLNELLAGGAHPATLLVESAPEPDEEGTSVRLRCIGYLLTNTQPEASHA